MTTLTTAPATAPTARLATIVPDASRRGRIKAAAFGALTYFGLSFAAFGSLIAAMAFFVPPLGLTDEGEIDKDRLLLIQQYLNAALVLLMPE